MCHSNPTKLEPMVKSLKVKESLSMETLASKIDQFNACEMRWFSLFIRFLAEPPDHIILAMTFDGKLQDWYDTLAGSDKETVREWLVSRRFASMVHKFKPFTISVKTATEAAFLLRMVEDKEQYLQDQAFLDELAFVLKTSKKIRDSI